MQLVPFAIAGIVSKLCISYLQQSSLYFDTQKPWSEWVAWGGLALACQIRKHKFPDNERFDGDKEAQKPPTWARPGLSHPSVLLASGLLIAELLAYKRVDRWLQWSLPLITLSTFFFTSLVRRGDETSNPINSEPLPLWQDIGSVFKGRRLHSNLLTITFIQTCIFTSIALGLSMKDALNVQIIFPITYMCLMTAIYVFLPRQVAGTSDGTSNGVIQMLEVVLDPLSISAFAICTVYLAMFSPPISNPLSTVLVLAILRAVQLISVLVLCLEKAGIAASTLATTTVAILDSTQTIPAISTMIYTIVALATLTQTYSLLNKDINRHWLFLLLLLPCSSFFNISMKLPSHLSDGNMFNNTTHGSIHPIEQLFTQANQQFSSRLANQSQTVEEAVTEYKRRHGRLPPPNFDRWFEIAQAKDFLFIDEFDTIMKSLEPYWGISPKTLRGRLRSIEEAPMLIKFKIHEQKIDVTSDHYHVGYLTEWLNFTTWKDLIPDTTFMISTLDEPRVVVPDDTLDLAVQNALSHEKLTPSNQNAAEGATNIKWISVGRQDAWEAMLSSCHIDSAARSEITKDGLSYQDPPLPFVENVTASRDVCASSDLLRHHGFFASPESLTITHSLVPVFSQCKPSIFNDVLYPSPYYEMQINSGDYNETEDKAWEEKLDRLYWAGSATGGFSNAQNWMKMHRQRITMMTASDSTLLTTLLQRDHNGFWKPFQSIWSSLANMFHLKITSVVQCSDEACEAMRARFKTEGQDPVTAALDSKYALDMDGNTFSGRYYRLLKSKVCVLKHTIFNEWHDDRLIPWVHYVPLSAGAEELGEIMRYFTQEEDGQTIGKAIADQGMLWSRKTLRKEDLEVVFVRILMEYARILDHNRDEMGFDIDS